MTSSYYRTPVDGGEAGALGRTMLALVQVETQNIPNATRIIVDRYINSPSTGWSLYLQNYNSNLQCSVNDGGQVPRSTTATALSNSDVHGRIHLLAMHVSAAGVLRQLGFRAMQLGASTASFVGFTPASPARHAIGLRYSNGMPATYLSILAHATAGDLTQAELEAIYDQTRLLGDIPRVVIGAPAWRHRWSIRDGGIAEGTRGATAPPELVDSATVAAIDLMAPESLPSLPMVRVHPNVSGRRSYGVHGFQTVVGSPSAGYQGPNFPGANVPFRVGVWLTLHALPGASAQIVCCANTAGTKGFFVQFGSSNMFQFFACNGTTFASVNFQMAAQQLGRPMYFECAWDGTNITLSVNGVSTGANVPIAFAHADLGELLTVGHWKNTQPLTTATIWAISLGLGVPTQPEIVACFNETSSQARLQTIPGKTSRHYSWSQDVEENGGPNNGLPEQATDRLGTAHLTRTSGLRVSGAGLRGFSGGDFLSTLPGAGLLGAPGGFHAIGDITLIDATTLQMPWHTTTLGSADRGFYLQVTGGYLSFLAVNTSGVATQSAQYLLQPGDLNTPLWCGGQLTAAGMLELWIRGARVGSPVAFTGTYGPSTGPTRIGNWTTSRALTGTARGLQGGHAEASPAEMLASYEAWQATGLLTSIPGKTLKRWQIGLDIAEAGGKAPAVVRERIGDAGTMVTVTTALQVSQRTEQLWSYEAA